jgi:hypothetical protein
VSNPMDGRVWMKLPGAPEGWLVTECGGGGDCFFHSVGVALRMSFADVRAHTADCVNEDNVDRLLTYYDKKYHEGNWNRKLILDLPNPAERVEAMKRVIRTTGPLYQGDDTTMRMLVNHHTLKVGFIVFYMKGDLHRQVFANRNTRRLIVLMFLPGHWQLVGQLIPNDPYHRVQTTFEPFPPPDFLAQKLADVDVDMVEHFAQWEPRLEL